MATAAGKPSTMAAIDLPHIGATPLRAPGVDIRQQHATEHQRCERGIKAGPEIQCKGCSDERHRKGTTARETQQRLISRAPRPQLLMRHAGVETSRREPRE